MTDKAEHVVMLQRSPGYVIAVPKIDKQSEKLRKYLPDMWVYRMGRTRNIMLTSMMFRMSRTFPNFVRNMLQKQVKAFVGPDVDMKHFTPKYNPWDQRLCAVPSGDMFRVLKQGKASVVTDHIDRFTANGIRLRSGEELKADIIITATGLELQLFGGMQVTVDGQAVNMADKLNYKGLMFNDMPNLSYTFGYTNASWTLKADLIAEYVCRLLKHMDATGTRICMPRQLDPTVKPDDFLDMTSGYVQRALAILPKSGNKAPWKLHQNYALDMNQLRRGAVDDGVMFFSKPTQRSQSMASPELQRATS
jgi:cation diffusion facilitator CzcD-associated flavoprotein CzcO